ncbi:taurine catabolism dioxygenase tauD, tfdA family protein [Sarocladium implicatum]|nr:taurine catabolism dioxygenase tauD, tfdA family protein [Sarocladium implicatum]
MSSTTTTAPTEPVTWVTPAARPPPGQPDISYAPDYDKWQARVASRLAEGNLRKDLPEGFPDQLTGDAVWDGTSLAETYDWTYILNEGQLAEIDRAVAHFRSLGLSLGHITPETFPLPTVRPELRRLSHELHSGHGFFVIRGIKVDEHSREDNVIIYAGVSAHIAPQRGRQDHKYDGKPADVVLTHIKDLSSADPDKIIGSPAYTTDKQVFHTDSGDIVSLFALETAKSGGASKLASTWKVYNEIARTRPDLIHTLTQPWDYEIFEKADKQWHSRPLLFLLPATEKSPQRIALQYARRYFVGFGALPRSEHIPPITEAQAEALDTLHFTGDKYCVNTEFQKGDIQYVNNLAVFHARDGFVDEGTKQRHLLRLWLRDPENAWQTPEVIQYRWDQIYGGVTPEAEVLPLEPFIRSASNKNR